MGDDLAYTYYCLRGRALRRSAAGAAYVYGQAEGAVGRLGSLAPAGCLLALQESFSALSKTAHSSEEQEAWAHVLLLAQRAFTPLKVV